MNFYQRIAYFLMDLCQLATENLHIMPFCKYQINQIRSSGSHTVVQGVNEKIKYFLVFCKFCLRSKYNPVESSSQHFVG